MTSAVPTSFEWILGSQVEGFIVRVVLDTSTNTFTLTSLLGSGDINALWFDNEGGGMTGPSTQLASRDNSLNMNGSGVTWDSMLKLSSAGLGQASVLGTETGASKQTFLNATGDSFSYTVDSLASWGITDWSAVTLGVRATSVNGSGSVKLVDTSANAAIVLVADTVIGNEDAGPISGNIFNNDSRVGDESTLPTINAFTVNLPGGQVSGTIGAPLILEGYGMLVLNSNGSFTFNPAQNYFGTLPVSYTVVDGNFVRTSTLTITVNPVNDAPTGTATAMLADGTEDAAYKVTAADLLQGFSDVDGDTLSVSDLSAGSNGTVVNNGDGTYTITPAANYNGLVTLSYSVTDGQGGTKAGSQSFKLAAVNDAAVITGATSGSVKEDVTLSTGGKLNIADVDSVAEALFQSVSSAAGASNLGSFTIDAAGNWTYALNNALPAVQALNEGGNLTDSFIFQSVDQTAVTVTVTINGTNEPQVTGVVNGDFTNGYSGWMTIGLPTLSGGQAHLQSGGGSQQINATAMEAFFLSNTGQAIDIPDSTANASGQAIMQKVLLADANATTARVSFQWAFDAPGGTNSNDDFAFYVTAAGSNRVVEIWSVQTGQPNGYLVSGSMDHNGSIIGTGMTGGDSLMMRTSTFEVSGITGGEFYLGFGIMDWQNGGTSVLTLDNIQIIA